MTTTQHNAQVERPFPELLSDDENKALLERAENMWRDLQANNLGGFSGVNRPFWILHEFRRVIEEFGHRDTGLHWSKNQLDAAALSTASVPPQALDTGEVARLRAALIEAGRNAGAILSDNVTTDFLMYVPGEVAFKIAKARADTFEACAQIADKSADSNKAQASLSADREFVGAYTEASEIASAIRARAALDPQGKDDR